MSPLVGQCAALFRGGTRIAWDLEENYSLCAPDHILSMVMLWNRFTLKQLKYFVTVVETESIAEASRQLHIAQPSISIAIKNLESTFDQQLFIRHHAQGVSAHLQRSADLR